MNYDFAQKNHWRRRVWNQLTERVQVHPKMATVLYLAGQENLDRGVALEKGFGAENLIAVDYEMKVITALRKAGQLAICGDIFDVITSWPEHTPLDAIIIDLCGGIKLDRIVALTRTLHFQSTNRAVFVLNARRGQDPDVAKIRGSFDVQGIPHRGAAYLRCALACLGMGLIDDVTTSQLNNWIDFREALTKRTYIEYRSGPAFYDSVIFNNPVQSMSTGITRDETNTGLILQIAAVLAHRTRRKAA